MRYEWLIDVMADLKAFADAQGLAATAAALDDASLIALAELSASAGAEASATGAGDHGGQSGSVTFLFAQRRHA